MAWRSDFWHVGFHRNNATGLRVLHGREHAIAVACDILDSGGEIFHLGPADQPRAIRAEELYRIRQQRRGQA